mmetsp:Transcript_131825/g.256801  ORF Transcript_131825/g.256801 Transcript_131825/m.256801 type:complete len:184 (-) Transcript_131825:44-595(-)
MANSMVAAGGGGGVALFNDAHSFMRNVSDEVDAVKRFIAAEDEKRRVEIEDLRRDQEQERFERRDALNSLRYEFEEFVRRKIDKVLEEVTEMKRMSRRDDSQQQQQINHLIADFDRLKENLFAVQSSWGKLVNNCVSPALQETVKQAELEAQEQQKVQQAAAPSSPPTMTRSRSETRGGRFTA